MKSVRRMGWLAGFGVAVSVWLGLGSPATAQENPLDQLPAGAEAVLVVPNLSAFSADAASVKQAASLVLPGFDDALAALKQSTGMANGVNDDGAMLLVLPDLTQAIAEIRRPSVLMLVPVSDYPAFIGNYGATGGEGVTPLPKIPGGGSGFAKPSGGYAVMSQDRAMVQGYAPGNAGAALTAKMGELGRKYLGEGDAYLFVDLEKVGPKLLTLIEQDAEKMSAKLDEAAAGGRVNPRMLANLKANYQVYAAFAKTLVRDSTSLVTSLDGGERGIAVTSALAFKPGSALAGILPGGNGGAAGLAQLPESPYLFAGAIDARAIDLGKFHGEMAKVMPAEGLAGMPAPELWLPLLQGTKSMSMALYAPNDMALMNNALVSSLTVVEPEDPKAYVAGFRKLIESTNGLEVPMAAPPPAAGQPAPEPIKVTYQTKYTENALVLGGTPVDEYMVSAKLPFELANQMGPAAGFMEAFSSFTGYVATKDGKAIITSVPDQHLVTQALQTVGRGGGIGAGGPIPQIREAALTPAPAAEGYINVGEIGNTISMFLSMFGQPPLQVPPDLPPAALSVGVQGESAAFRAYLPIQTFKFLVETGTQLRQPPQPNGQPSRRPPY